MKAGGICGGRGKGKKKDEIRFEKQTVERRGGRTLAKNPNDFKGEGHE